MPAKKTENAEDSKRDFVSNLVIAGYNASKIAEVTGESVEDVERDYGKELLTAKAGFDSLVIKTVRDMVKKGNPQVVIHYLKTRLNFVEGATQLDEGGATLRVELEKTLDLSE